MPRKLEDRKGYSFTLHIEEDKDLIEFLEKNKVTKSVKEGLRLLMEQEKKQNQVENLKEQLLVSMISLLSQSISSNNILPLQNLLQNQQIAMANQEKDQEQLQKTNQKTEEVDEETEQEYQKIVQELGGRIGPIRL